MLASCTADFLARDKSEPPTILASVSEPLNGDAFPVNGAIKVSANAVSDGAITRLELWVDGEMVHSYTPSLQDLYYVSHTWEWSVEQEGEHTFVARADNHLEGFSQSNVVNISTVADPGFILIYITRAGETLDQIAADTGSTREAILLANAEANLTGPLPEGLEIRVPIGVNEEALRSVPVTHRNIGSLLPARLTNWLRGANLAAMP